MKRVLLLYVYNDKTGIKHEDIGVCMIASVIKHRGNPIQLATIKSHDVNIEKIKQFNPDIVGFTVYRDLVEDIDAIIRQIHDELPNVVFILGGAHATFNSEELIRENKFIKYVVRGEGEATIIDLLETLESGSDIKNVNGITYRDCQNRICKNEDRELIKDLDSLPFAARNLFEEKNPVAVINTSRGCISNCTFCSSKVHWKKWRGRSPQNVINEIEMIKSNYGIDAFFFMDCSFEDPDRSLKRLKSMAEDLIDRKLNITYFAFFRTDFSRNAENDIMQLLFNSGLRAVTLGIESNNEEDLKLYNKISNKEDNHKTINLFKKFNIAILPGFINFNPYSNIEKIKSNFELLRKYNICYRFFSFLTVYSNTKILNNIKKDGLVTGYNNGVYYYKYADDLASNYSSFIKLNIDKINHIHNNAFEEYINYSEMYVLLLGYSKRKIILDGNSELSFKLEEASSKLEESVIEMDGFIEKWISDTLNTIDNTFCEIELDFLKFKEQLEKIKQKRKRVFMLLVAHGYEHLIHKTFM